MAFKKMVIPMRTSKAIEEQPGSITSERMAKAEDLILQNPPKKRRL